ncbi:hypothetical protein DO021_15445 [Desulfobacter hydrogenophilus]|uniref:Uncharacterized protein n=1 Tax=Desulfobacter hydrogenophilus TaxID=2291 RepID=A0A328FCE3_9BACT|nr:hypothetical protein [Desulfobacter hydrogenophilus]NDY73076.1 hypothetical protein [Desulfobacter hydrogenophilus]QBH13574.1 hypothetical protein EYB58_11940 [Desulfobacter hydrogenophilus]RAM01082.1 hypothetical protein DO021_15445 [Desulfobacter hydrogenophilus]
MSNKNKITAVELLTELQVANQKIGQLELIIQRMKDEQKKRKDFFLPHEILRGMGFDIPEDGIYLNPVDSYLHTKILELVGGTIDIDRIPEAGLIELQTGIEGVCMAHGKTNIPGINQSCVGKGRILIRALIEHTYNFSPSVRPETESK